eukprot:TRINITY_DN11145_c0_g1_i3.p1 TRINITY_DN11145_c0_g1~~TRINITY_DN11145_c0_g1_i3.p1  ORF type:complete len:693 (+),score=63.68 TRINITY_DN11145_c0_g1_i3:1-2079(+)
MYIVISFFFLMIRRPPRSTQSRSSAASDVYKRQTQSTWGHIFKQILMSTKASSHDFYDIKEGSDEGSDQERKQKTKGVDRLETKATVEKSSDVRQGKANAVAVISNRLNEVESMVDGGTSQGNTSVQRFNNFDLNKGKPKVEIEMSDGASSLNDDVLIIEKPHQRNEKSNTRSKRSQSKNANAEESSSRIDARVVTKIPSEGLNLQRSLIVETKSPERHKLKLAISLDTAPILSESNRLTTKYLVMGHEEKVRHSESARLMDKFKEISEVLKETQNKTESQINEEVIEGKPGEQEAIDDLFEEFEYESRYFNVNPTQICRRCGKAGHFERMCAMSVQRFTCLFCLGDHRNDECEQTVCFRCNGMGHRRADCNTRRDTQCHVCRKFGHKRRDCQVICLKSLSASEDEEADREYIADEKLIVCIECGEEGHAVCDSLQHERDNLYLRGESVNDEDLHAKRRKHGHHEGRPHHHVRGRDSRDERGRNGHHRDHHSRHHHDRHHHHGYQNRFQFSNSSDEEVDTPRNRGKRISNDLRDKGDPRRVHKRFKSNHDDSGEDVSNRRGKPPSFQRKLKDYKTKRGREDHGNSRMKDPHQHDHHEYHDHHDHHRPHNGHRHLHEPDESSHSRHHRSRSFKNHEQYEDKLKKHFKEFLHTTPQKSPKPDGQHPRKTANKSFSRDRSRNESKARNSKKKQKA